MAGVVVEDPIPEAWRRLAAEAGCPDPARGWVEDAGPAADEERGRRAVAESERAIAETLAAVARYWPGLAPT
jgi:hypothetical protein